MKQDKKRSTLSLSFMFHVSCFLFLISNGFTQSAKLNTDQIKIFNQVSDKLVCQCSCLMILSVCNHENCPSATPMRKEIEEKIEQGQDINMIINGFVKTHGLKVLSAPPVQGFHLTAWIIPGLILIVGLATVIILLKSFRKKNVLQTHSPALNQELDCQIEKELKEFKNDQ